MLHELEHNGKCLCKNKHLEIRGLKVNECVCVRVLEDVSVPSYILCPKSHLRGQLCTLCFQLAASLSGHGYIVAE